MHDCYGFFVFLSSHTHTGTNTSYVLDLCVQFTTVPRFMCTVYVQDTWPMNSPFYTVNYNIIINMSIIIFNVS